MTAIEIAPTDFGTSGSGIQTSEAVPAQEPGELVSWDGPNDPQNPYNWSVRYKWLITALTSAITINVLGFTL